MTPEFKQRIEQIRNGEVPEGYKRTRAGIMPCDWCTQKEYKAKDIFYSVSNKNHNGDYEVLSATQDRGVIPRSQVDIDIKYDDANTSGYKMVDKGDFVISLRSFQGGIEYSEYTGLVSPAYTVLKPRVSICDEYYKSYFKTNDFISRLNKGTYGIRDGKQVGFKDFGEMIIHFPPLPEQQRIAKIISTQDKVIECYEKKIEQLKRVKKYYLQNMFPKRGETVPKIRFKGFTESWEQRKLGQISTFINGRAYSQSELLPNGKYKVLRVGNFYTNDSWYYSDLELGEKYYANFGDLLYTWSTTFGPHLWLGDKVIYHYHIWKVDLSDQLEKHFAIQLLEQDKNNIMSGKNGSTMVHITKEGMEQKEVIIPPDISEQAKIGAFFGRIDNLITLHQRKLEEEKKKKKALQQLLLTGIVRTN